MTPFTSSVLVIQNPLLTAIAEGNCHMKKKKFSLIERKTLRMIVLSSLIQLIIFLLFLCLLISSQQIDVNDTKQIDIIVDDIYYSRVSREYWLFIVSDSTKYLFKGRPTFEEYSVDELYESISRGSKLSLRYYETHSILGKVNLVVDARSETETYRSIEEYNQAKQGIPIVIFVLFSIIELLFVGIVFLYVYLNYNTIKGVCTKLKNLFFNKKKN